MVGFVEDFINLKVPKEGVVRTTLSELNYFSAIANEWIRVPVGLDTDLGSIPRPLQVLFPKDGKAVLGYILHDYLYKYGKYDRDTCDDILEESMLSLGVGIGTRKAVRYGLLVGGFPAWNEHRKNDMACDEATWN